MSTLLEVTGLRKTFPVKAGDGILCRFDQGLGEVATSFV